MQCPHFPATIKRIGRLVPSSKLQFSWKFRLDKTDHCLILTLSRLSSTYRIELDGEELGSFKGPFALGHSFECRVGSRKMVILNLESSKFAYVLYLDRNEDESALSSKPCEAAKAKLRESRAIEKAHRLLEERKARKQSDSKTKKTEASPEATSLSLSESTRFEHGRGTEAPGEVTFLELQMPFEGTGTSGFASFECPLPDFAESAFRTSPRASQYESSPVLMRMKSGRYPQEYEDPFSPRITLTPVSNPQSSQVPFASTTRDAKPAAFELLRSSTPKPDGASISPVLEFSTTVPAAKTRNKIPCKSTLPIEDDCIEIKGLLPTNHPSISLSDLKALYF